MPPEGRRNEGLQAAFTSIFPIVSHSQNARLEFVSYSLGEPPFDVKECQQRGLTYASPDRKSTRLNSSHLVISYAVFCLKKKKKQIEHIINTLNTHIKFDRLHI